MPFFNLNQISTVLRLLPNTALEASASILHAKWRSLQVMVRTKMTCRHLQTKRLLYNYVNVKQKYLTKNSSHNTADTWQATVYWWWMMCANIWTSSVFFPGWIYGIQFNLEYLANLTVRLKENRTSKSLVNTNILAGIEKLKMNTCNFLSALRYLRGTNQTPVEPEWQYELDCGYADKASSLVAKKWACFYSVSVPD